VHLRIRDTSILEDFEEQELTDPSPRKRIGQSFIFKSRDLAWDQDPGHPILCDFGEARYGKTSYTDPIQPSAYRSPEVMFGIPWKSSVDIWNVGVMVRSSIEHCRDVITNCYYITDMAHVSKPIAISRH
jgi:serine/threonine protein kinase